MSEEKTLQLDEFLAIDDTIDVDESYQEKQDPEDGSRNGCNPRRAHARLGYGRYFPLLTAIFRRCKTAKEK